MNVQIISKPDSNNFIRHYAGVSDRPILVTKDTAQVANAIKDADVVLYEWANDFTAECLSVLDHTGKKVVVRIHDHEVRLGRIHRIKWNNVRAWFINRDVQSEFHGKYYPGVKSFFLPNACDPSGFVLSNDKKRHVGFLSIYCRWRKRPDRVLDIAQACPSWHFTLRMAMYCPDHPQGQEAGREYVREIRERIDALPNVTLNARDTHFTRTGYPFADVSEFFQDKAVVLSVSESEGFHYAICEAAYCGAYPMVLNWNAGRPYDFWGPFVHESVADIAARLNAPVGFPSPRECREWVEKRYSPAALIPKLKEELEKI